MHLRAGSIFLKAIAWRPSAMDGLSLICSLMAGLVKTLRPWVRCLAPHDRVKSSTYMIWRLRLSGAVCVLDKGYCNAHSNWLFEIS